MADLFRHFFWLIFPIMGMGIGAFAIWNEFSRQKKALEVLKVYAEKGTEPPESVLAVLNRASVPNSRWASKTHWGRAAFFIIMSAGFGVLTFWSARSGAHEAWPFGMVAFVMAALAASALVNGFVSLKMNGFTSLDKNGN